MESESRTVREADCSLSMDRLKQELSDLEGGSFTSLTDDELREKIRQIHSDFRINAPTFAPGLAIYRAVKVSQRPLHSKRVSYPPSEFIKTNGRLNRSGEAMFYGSVNLFTSLQECAWQVGDFFAVSGWLTSEPMTFNHLGYATSVLSDVKTQRELPDFARVSDSTERNALVREWQGRVFTKAIAGGQEHLYRLPIALRDFALSKMVQPDLTRPNLFSGIIYPSVAMWLLSDNFAILPSEADEKMKLFEVILLTLNGIKIIQTEDGGKNTSYDLKTYDYARPDDQGNLVWGQNSQIVYPPGVDASQFTPTVLPPE